MAKIGKVQEVCIVDLKPYENNAKMHGAEQVDLIARSITEFGFLNPCLIDKEMRIIAGHGRVMAAKQLGYEKVPCLFVEGLTEEQRKAYILADNKLTELGEWDMELVQSELAELDEMGFDVSLTGFEFEKTPEQEKNEAEEAVVTLAERFLISPFTVLDSRTGWWNQRKRAWKNLGIKSEIGRGNDEDRTKKGLCYAASHQPPDVYKKKNAYEEKVGRKVTWDEFYEAFPNAARHSGTSIFDPVLCEIGYRWFCPKGGKILDPFAGGSVRGIVAALLGKHYTGVDLSERQILANRENWETVTHTTIETEEEAISPNWIVGDSTTIDKLVEDDEYDLIFTCPPYASLEVYSDKPEDLSNKSYDEFIALFKQVVSKSVKKLKKDAFAVCVVGDLRDKNGHYCNFVSDTIEAFREAGMHLYNEGILVTSQGSLAISAAKPFEQSRKLAKCHQNFLVFINEESGEIEELSLDSDDEQAEEIADYISRTNGKLASNHDKVLVFSQGDEKKAAEACGTVDTEDIEGFEVDI